MNTTHEFKRLNHKAIEPILREIKESHDYFSNSIL